jgi:uncharacterized protein YndB with AHSA1/START domain
MRAADARGGCSMGSPPSNVSHPWALGASARATIAATPEQLWDWVADPTRHPTLAGSGEPQSIQMVDGQQPGLGACFEAQQKMFGLLRYVSRSEIVIYEPYRHFRFVVGGLSVWEFQLEPADGGTRVTHRHRLEPPAAMRLLVPIVKRRARQNADNMARTLQNLARLTGALPPTDIQVSYEAPQLA